MKEKFYIIQICKHTNSITMLTNSIFGAYYAKTRVKDNFNSFKEAQNVINSYVKFFSPGYIQNSYFLQIATSPIEK